MCLSYKISTVIDESISTKMYKGTKTFTHPAYYLNTHQNDIRLFHDDLQAQLFYYRFLMQPFFIPMNIRDAQVRRSGLGGTGACI